jgi:hypothetical protein
MLLMFCKDEYKVIKLSILYNLGIWMIRWLLKSPKLQPNVVDQLSSIVFWDNICELMHSWLLRCKFACLFSVIFETSFIIPMVCKGELQSPRSCKIGIKKDSIDAQGLAKVLTTI